MLNIRIVTSIGAIDHFLVVIHLNYSTPQKLFPYICHTAVYCNNLTNIYITLLASPRSTVVSSDNRCGDGVVAGTLSSPLTVFGGGSVGAAASSDILFFARSYNVVLLLLLHSDEIRLPTEKLRGGGKGLRSSTRRRKHVSSNDSL